MRGATLMVLAIFTGAALAHPGHGAPATHWHGVETLLVVLVALMLAVLLTRR